MPELSHVYKKSVLDNVSDSISPILRDVTDIQLQIFGTATQILRLDRRIYQRQTNELQNLSVTGDFDLLLEKSIYQNCQINYPFNDLEIFVSRQFTSKGYSTAETNIHGMDVTDVLPITMNMLFEGTYDSDPIEIKKDDLVVDVFWDASNNPLPIILQVMRLRGSFFGKNQVTKRCELSLYRKELSQEIEEVVVKYLDYIYDSRKEEQRILNQKGYPDG